MADRTHAGLPVERIRRVLAPLAEANGELTLAIEDAEGSPVVAIGQPQATGGIDAGSSRLTRELRASGALVGRLVASTPADTARSSEALLEALAVGIEELVDQERDLAVGRQPSGTADPTTLAADLALSRMQQRMIVSLQAPAVVGYEMASHYEPAREVGGDFFELFRIRKRGRPLGVVIADVAGKGIAAALLMAFARPVIHTALTAAPGPGDALERVNRILVHELHTALFITAIAARLDIRSGVVRLANAGHELPLLVPGDGGPISTVPGGGPLMGAFPDLRLIEREIPLGPGDQLLLYTDGVTDTRSTTGERFGRERLLATIERSRGQTAFELVAAIRDDLGAFGVDAVPADDVTIVVIGRARAA